jgi:ubiquinone/menaquinone biosynthesis C-methylase UbiE
MIPRPESHSEKYSSRFQHQSVVDRYHLRPTYPPQTFELLNGLIVDSPRIVLDVGCGTGNVARPLSNYVERVDAVDVSLPMLARARTLPGGDSSKIRWLHGRVEDVEFEPPYALITAGESLHWMEWGVVLPRFARLLTRHGVLAIAYVIEQPEQWYDGYLQIVKRFSTNPTYVPIDWIAELEKYHLFHKLGERCTEPLFVRQTIEDYIASQHARSSLSLESMTPENAAQFDTQMQALLLPFAQDGLLSLHISGGITWGKPLDGKS